nr:hypothetical protein [Corynebacterium guaraldiae]
MGGAFSYASFSRANGRAGGWGVGQKAGDITQEELAELVSFVPTSLNNGTTIPDFPSAQQRAELVRRTAVFALTPEAEKWVTMVSVPAGLDATGRGGNVFTYTSISRTGTPRRRRRSCFLPISQRRFPSTRWTKSRFRPRSRRAVRCTRMCCWRSFWMASSAAQKSSPRRSKP